MKTKISNFFKKIFNWFEEQINAYIIGRSVLKLAKALNEIEEKNPEVLENITFVGVDTFDDILKELYQKPSKKNSRKKLKVKNNINKNK